MPFPQDQIFWLIANRSKLVRYAFIPQLFVSLLFLGFAYQTGKIHAHLLFHGSRTQGRVVGSAPILFRSRSSTGGGSTFSETVYMPIFEFRSGDRLVRIQEWKGSSSRISVGSMVPVLYDPSDPSVAMMDRDWWNWLPWGPCFAIGVILVLAAIKGLVGFLFQRDPDQVNPFERLSASNNG